MARIHLKQNYSGGRPTKERPIAAGIYDESDPALFGQAAYLADDLKIAVWLDARSKAVTAIEPAPRLIVEQLPIGAPERLEPVHNVFGGAHFPGDTFVSIPQASEDAVIETIEVDADLVDDGEGDELPDETLEEIADDAGVDYDSMTVKELADLMDERELDLPITGSGRGGAVVKADYIAALVDADLFESGEN